MAPPDVIDAGAVPDLIGDRDLKPENDLDDHIAGAGNMVPPDLVPSCAPCPLGTACGADGDCASGACSRGVCVLPHCNNGVREALAGETDVDCGGSCPACVAGQGCAVDADCDGICKVTICFPPPPAHCSDGKQDVDEANVDCGGRDCQGCAPGAYCNNNFDCNGSYCEVCAGGGSRCGGGC